MKKQDILNGAMENEQVLSEAKLKRFLELAYNLRRAVEHNMDISSKAFEESKMMLATLLDYLIRNKDNPNVDVTLIEFLEHILGMRKQLQKDDLQDERKQSFAEREKKRVERDVLQHRKRMLMYEMYKIINPRQLAGETRFQNFMSNVMTRGIEVAMKYEGKEFVKLFTNEEIDNLTSYRTTLKQMIHEQTGAIGKGRGW